jgi:hypothetical protein
MGRIGISIKDKSTVDTKNGSNRIALFLQTITDAVNELKSSIWKLLMM